MIAVTLLVIPALVLEETSFGGDVGTTIGSILNWMIWLAFLAEMIVMLSVVPKKGLYLRKHPLDVAIVILTPPFVPPGLQALRVFRLLRVLGWCGSSRCAGSSRLKECETRQSSRRSWCSRMGVPMRTLMEWIGHRDLTTLIYADYMSSERERGWVEAAFARSTPGTELSETQRTERT
jgi:hypothetical protein